MFRLLAALLVIVLLILLVHFLNFDLWRAAEQSLQISAILHLIKYQLKLVAFEQIVRQTHFFAQNSQFLNGRRREDRIDYQSAYKWDYLKAFSSMVGMTLPRSGQASSRQGLVLTSISQTLKF